jgi:hypothetical protein
VGFEVIPCAGDVFRCRFPGFGRKFNSDEFTKGRSVQKNRIFLKKRSGEIKFGVLKAAKGHRKREAGEFKGF